MGKKPARSLLSAVSASGLCRGNFIPIWYFWLVKNTIGTVETSFDPITKVRLPTPLDCHVNSNYFTSRCMEKSWELIFTTHKPQEKIAVPVLFGQKDKVAYLSAIYGAKKYYRDVTHEILYHFVRGDKIIIPKSADLNAFFTDVVPFMVKTLKITINGQEHLIPENRPADTIIAL